MSVWRPLLACAAALLAAACATDYAEPPPSSPPVVTLPPGAPAPRGAAPSVVVPGAGTLIPVIPPTPGVNYPKTIQDSDAGPAVLSLYRQAQDARAGNHPDQAEALLERALHIEPRNAFVWQSLAGVRLDLSHPDQAKTAAERSNSLARGNPYVVAGNWRLIAAALQAQGDTSGAQQAQAQADGITRTLPGSP